MASPILCVYGGPFWHRRKNVEKYNSYFLREFLTLQLRASSPQQQLRASNRTQDDSLSFQPFLLLEPCPCDDCCAHHGQRVKRRYGRSFKVVEPQSVLTRCSTEKRKIIWQGLLSCRSSQP